MLNPAQIAYLYWNGYKRKDPLVIRLFVIFLFVADTAHTAFTMAYMYICLVNHYGNPLYLANANWVFSADPALTGIIGGSVQIFFSWRVKILTGHSLLAGTIATSSCASLLCGIATAIACGFVPAFAQFQRFKVVVIIWLAASSLSDILITGSLVNHLRSHKTGFRTTDTHVDRIIRLTVQTGLITSLWAHLMLNFALSKLYTNSLMSSLNSRKGWHYSDSRTSGASGQPSGQRMRKHDIVTVGGGRAEVFVQVESHEMVDEGKTIALGDRVTYGGASRWGDGEAGRKGTDETV
uniref:DUF6534 domain-containing protein n=1 Tax=Schizophyllum commune (strain H4-8 / FGSC 9210) TaxID=578458 RepID=D8PX47_SCHCM